MVWFLTNLIAIWIVAFGALGDAWNWATGKLDDSVDNSGIAEEVWDSIAWLVLFCVILLSGEDLRLTRIKEVRYQRKRGPVGG